MADGNALSGLYPQPPAPSSGLLSGDPSKVIDLARGANALSLFPMQRQQLQQQLVGQQIENATRAQNLNNLYQTNIAAAFSAIDPKKATPDTVHSLIATLTANGYPPPVAARMEKMALEHPQGLAAGIAALQNFANPAGVSTPLTVTRPGGQQETIPASQFVRENAGVSPVGGTAPTPAPASSAAGGPFLGPEPGVVTAKEKTGGESGASLADARNAASNYRRQVTPLEKAIPALQRLGTGGTGVGTEAIQNIRSFAQTVGVPIGGKTADDIKDYDTARKYLQDWVSQNSNTQSVQHLLHSTSSNPSVSISNMAAGQLAQTALALRRMQHDQLQQFNKSGMKESEYSKFAADWNAKQNPDFYRMDLMTPAERNKFAASHIASMPGKTAKEKEAAFYAKVREAEGNGIFGYH